MFPVPDQMNWPTAVNTPVVNLQILEVYFKTVPLWQPIDNKHEKCRLSFQFFRYTLLKLHSFHLLYYTSVVPPKQFQKNCFVTRTEWNNCEIDILLCSGVEDKRSKRMHTHTRREHVSWPATSSKTKKKWYTNEICRWSRKKQKHLD